MSRPFRIYVDHGEAYGNLGDEAMLLNALMRLQRHLGPCQFVVPRVDGQPLPDLSLYRVRYVPPPHVAFRPLRRLVEAVMVIVRGATRLLGLPERAATTRVWAWVAGLVARTTRLRGVPAWLEGAGVLRVGAFMKTIRGCDGFYGVGAADLNDVNPNGVIYKCWLYGTIKSCVPVSVVAAQGIGPLQLAWTRNLVSRVIDDIDILTFRDHHYSADVVRGMAPTRTRHAVVGDEAFSLPAASDADTGAYLTEMGMNSGQSFIAFHWRMTDYTKETRPLLSKVAAILDATCELGSHRIVFFPMSYNGHSTRDAECGTVLRGMMVHSSRLVLAPVCRNAGVVKGAIGASRYSLGLSYHLHVFSLSQGHPAVMLYSGEYYRLKSEGLIAFYEPPNAALDVEAVSIGEVLRTVRGVDDAYDTACASIRRINRNIAKVNDWSIEEMAKILRTRRRGETLV